MAQATQTMVASGLSGALLRRSIPSETVPEAAHVKRRPVLFAPALADCAPSEWVELPYPAKDPDSGSGSPSSVYSRKVVYHEPMTIAMHLRKGCSGERSAGSISCLTTNPALGSPLTTHAGGCAGWRTVEKDVR
jgi:hypothetical protein